MFKLSTCSIQQNVDEDIGTQTNQKIDKDNGQTKQFEQFLINQEVFN